MDFLSYYALLLVIQLSVHTSECTSVDLNSQEKGKNQVHAHEQHSNETERKINSDYTENERNHEQNVSSKMNSTDRKPSDSVNKTPHQMNETKNILNETKIDIEKTVNTTSSSLRVTANNTTHRNETKSTQQIPKNTENNANSSSLRVAANDRSRRNTTTDSKGNVHSHIMPIKSKTRGARRYHNHTVKPARKRTKKIQKNRTVGDFLGHLWRKFRRNFQKAEKH